MSDPRTHLVILGAGRAKGDPYGLQRVTLERRVLDWQLDAFASLDPEINFVGGYGIDQIIRNYPQLTYHYNADWQSTGPVASLAVALAKAPEIAERGSDLFVLYSDILLRPQLVKHMLSAPAGTCTAALDLGSRNDEGIEGQERLEIGGASGEFIGLLRVPAEVVPAFAALTHAAARDLKTARLSRLVDLAVAGRLPWQVVDASGLWAHAEYGRSVARFVLGTKAATLHRLTGKLEKSRVLPLCYFRRREWTANAQDILRDTVNALGTAGPYIVRSSAIDEDGFASSKAGSFHSEFGVAPEEAPLRAAIDKVFESYTSVNSNDEVLVQPQLAYVEAAGVIFTRCLGNGAPYRVISLTKGSSTDAVTAGNDSDGIVLYSSRKSTDEATAALPEIGRGIIAAAEEIEACVCHDALDIEFAVTSSKEVITLQVRPLMVSDTAQDRTRDTEIDDVLQGVERSLRELEPPPPGQFGDAAVWSVMADWNPAEIIGLRPGPLALDLYRHIITDGVWARQREEAGYRRVGAHPLVRGFGGQAYIDVRASVNSFIPASLTDAAAKRMANYGLARLREHPDLHDKIEFEIVPTALDFDLSRWYAAYRDAGCLSEGEFAELRSGLLGVTRTIIERTTVEGAKVAALDGRWVESGGPASDSEWLRHTLSICRDEGAMPFAHLARAGFVAASLLRSAASRGLLSPERCADLTNSITTVAGTLARDAWRVKTGAQSRQAFIDRYGHLRPGTYDITTPSYRSRPVDYIDPIIDAAHPSEDREFAWTAAERRALDDALGEIKLGLTADSLLGFIHDAVVGREYAKFVFTRMLSAALDRIGDCAERSGISLSEAECLPLAFLLESNTDVWGVDGGARTLRELTQMRARRFYLAGLVTLPPVIRSANDVHAFQVPTSQPSFITSDRASGPMHVLKAGAAARQQDVEGKIVAILNADPGFDYLFALGIRGLVTAFGGPNSHMAIRASEFGLPAVMGIGEHAFAKLKENAMTELDCRKRLWRQDRD